MGTDEHPVNTERLQGSTAPLRRVFRFNQKIVGADLPCVPARYRTGPDSPSGRLTGVHLRPATGDLWLTLRSGGMPGNGRSRVVAVNPTQPESPTPDALPLKDGMRVRCAEVAIGKLEGLAIEVRSGVAGDLLVHVRNNILGELQTNSSPMSLLLPLAGRSILLSPAWVHAIAHQPGALGFGDEPLLDLHAEIEQVASATVLRPDADLASNVNSILGENPALAPLLTHISVQVQDGTVQLQGTVPSARHRASAEQEVWHVPGVLAVRNGLSVR